MSLCLFLYLYRCMSVRKYVCMFVCWDLFPCVSVCHSSGLFLLKICLFILHFRNSVMRFYFLFQHYFIKPRAIKFVCFQYWINLKYWVIFFLLSHPLNLSNFVIGFLEGWKVCLAYSNFKIIWTMYSIYFQF